MKRLSALCLVALATLPAVAAADRARTDASPLPGLVPLRTWTADGTVHAIVPAAGRVYLGGEFYTVGRPENPVMPLHIKNGRPDLSFPQVSGGEVLAVESDGRGGLFLGGYFTHVGALRCESLAHVLASGAVDAHWCPRPDSSVNYLARGRGRLYLAGDFKHVGGVRRVGLAAVTTRAGRPTSWRPAGGAAARIRGLAVGGGTVFAVGDFQSLGGRLVHNVAALDPRTGRARPWYAQLELRSCSTCKTPVGAVATSGGTVYIAGYFRRVQGGERNCLAALDIRSGRLLPWQANTDGCYQRSDWRLVTSRSRIYVVGNFERIRGQRRDWVAAFDARTGRLLPWQPRLPPESAVNELAIAGSAVAVAYEEIETETDRMRLVDARTGRRVVWTSPYFDGYFGSTVASGRRVVAVSWGTDDDGIVLPRHPSRGLAAFDPKTRRMTSWHPRVNGSVYALAASSTTLYVGGCFSKVGSEPRAHLAAFDLRTGALLPWNPGTDDCVENLVLAGSTLYLAGQDITSVGGSPRIQLAAVDASTGAVRPWDPHPSKPAPHGDDPEVWSLAAAGGTIYVGGQFTEIGGAARTNLAALDPETGTATTWDPRPDGLVTAVEPAGDTVYVGGDFRRIGTIKRYQVAAIDSATGATTSFDARVRLDLHDGVTLRVLGNVLFVGSFFDSFAVNGVTGRRLGWPYRGEGWRLGSAFAFARDGRRLFVGGDLELAGGSKFLVFPFPDPGAGGPGHR